MGKPVVLIAKKKKKKKDLKYKLIKERTLFCLIITLFSNFTFMYFFSLIFNLNAMKIGSIVSKQ